MINRHFLTSKKVLILIKNFFKVDNKDGFAMEITRFELRLFFVFSNAV